jgi:hypothetical protein
MNAEPKQDPNAVWQRLIMSEEDRRQYPRAPAWDGGYRWFRSPNVVDLQHYRSAAEKERIRRVLLNGWQPRSNFEKYQPIFGH